ncbi:MAG TPA: diguanylate cyclase [Solirubrobacteraceae bacterium]|jgi:diguanylate cyclase (GGDEF)-like protein/PAS domain S-box-containing protein|nr:diguanylate cyclase [Solirubrobacteraceae bacterium]
MDVAASSTDHAASPGDGGVDWSLLLAGVSVALVAFDRELTVVACAGAADPGLVGRPLRAALPGPFEAFDAPLDAILAGQPSSVVDAIDDEDGTRTHEVELAPTRGPAGQVTGGIAVIRDVTVSRGQATQLFETAFANAPIGLALVSLEGRWLKVNGALCQWLGYTEAELLTQTFQEITHPDDLDADLRQVQRLIAGEIERYAMPKRYVTRDGDEVWANLSVSLVRDDQGRPVHFISQLEDISERKRLEIALQHLADHDHLTELWNRRAFESHLRRQIAQCRRGSSPAALLIVDLDGFKLINDTHGHAAGDALLVSVANTLRARLRATDCIARIGGDEFAVILSETRPEAVERVVESLAQQIRDACVEVGGRDIGVSASIGVAILDRNAPDEREALDAADRAMYARKGTRPPGQASD